MNNILVTGGAGYIGSFMVKKLLHEGFDVVVADNLERGHEKSLDPKSKICKGDLRDKEFVKKIFSENSFSAVIHFAGYISMGESMQNPNLYFENNLLSSLNVLEEMRKNKVSNFIFSSTAGVYGNPQSSPISEDHPKEPTNPYGESKLAVERALHWYQKIFDLSFVALRYFNAAGASIDGSMGEDHKPESHIIPNAINAALNGSDFDLYGDDYETKDGTCVRDYVHVIDLVEAHLLALSKLERAKGGFYYNVGTGNGYSNKEVIGTIKKISGIDFKVNIDKRREGDASVLVADASKIKNELGFAPKYSDLETIVKSAWEWHKSNLKSNPPIDGQNSK